MKAGNSAVAIRGPAMAAMRRSEPFDGYGEQWLICRRLKEIPTGSG
jgi:hypothetical protein